ncbi:MAG TPA: site-2 protease family protein [Candidatus Limnocylindria bacterium]|jgi:Zn-dependent protease|nr:site-2 protease family protein [Candidatus Limnocylindria bacterium]
MLFGAPSLDVLLAAVIALLVGLTFHEFSHALVADELGDGRPRAMGRLTLNPIPHIDPIGAVMLLIAGFGWAKPVMVNPYALRNGVRSMWLVAAAGPVANFVVAIGFAVIYRVLDLAGVEGGFLVSLVRNVVLLNVLLALFNFIPIPPLDGYNAVLSFLPPRTAMTVQRYAPYGILVLLLLIILPDSPLGLLFRAVAGITGVLIGA